MDTTIIMDTTTAGAMIAASAVVQIVLLVLHRRRGDATVASGMLAGGLAAMGAGAGILYAVSRPYTLLISVVTAGLLMAGFSLGMAALGAAATGARKSARGIVGATVLLWLLHLLAKAYDPGGMTAGLVELVFVAAISVMQGAAILRVRLPSPLTLVTGIASLLMGAAAVAAAILLAIDGPGSFRPLGFAGAAGAGFVFQQAIFGAVLLLAKERCDARAKGDSTHDQLTGLLNPAGFIEAMNKSLSLCARQNTAYSVIHFNIDEFGSVNAARGMAGGDRVLLDFAAKLGGHIRPYDHFARFDGDRFYLFLQTVNRDLAPSVVARMLGGVGMPSDGVMAYKVSAVAVCVDFPSGRHVALDDLLAAADAAMRDLKARGGARIEIAPF